MTSITSLLGCTQNTRRLQKQQNMLRSQTWRKGMVSSECVSLLLAGTHCQFGPCSFLKVKWFPKGCKQLGYLGFSWMYFFKPPDPAFRWSLKIPANWTLFSGVPSSELVLDMLSVEPTPTLQESQSHTFLVLQVGKWNICKHIRLALNGFVTATLTCSDDLCLWKDSSHRHVQLSINRTTTIIMYSLHLRHPSGTRNLPAKLRQLRWKKWRGWKFRSIMWVWLKSLYGMPWLFTHGFLREMLLDCNDFVSCGYIFQTLSCRPWKGIPLPHSTRKQCSFFHFHVTLRLLESKIVASIWRFLPQESNSKTARNG